MVYGMLVISVFTRQHKKHLSRYILTQFMAMCITLFNQCDYKATQKSNLKTHINSAHRDVCYFCDQCDYKATWKVSLKKHIDSVHKGVRYACDQCDYEATQNRTLIMHQESVHKDVRYNCDQIPK